MGEIERYKKRYNVDLENKNNYDLIIDTSYATTKDIVNTILTCEKCYEEGKAFARDWDSPLTMIPCQKIGQTWKNLFSNQLSLEELKDNEDLAENLLRRVKNDPNLTFSYSKIYPNILDEIEKDPLKNER